MPRQPAPLSPLAQNVRSLRIAANLSQEQLAQQVDANATYISRLETDAASPDFAFIQRLAAALNTTTQALITKPVAAMTEAERELSDVLASIPKLRNQSRKEVLGIIRNFLDGFDVENITYKRAVLPSIETGSHIMPDNEVNFPERGESAIVSTPKSRQRVGKQPNRKPAPPPRSTDAQ